MADDLGPYSHYRLTVRLLLKNRPAAFARVSEVLARHKANLGAVDIVDVTRERMIRDVTFDVAGEAHGQEVVAALKRLRSVKVLSVSDRLFLLHLGGKIEVTNRFPIGTRNRLSMVYTPGVARVSQAIAADPSKAHNLTVKHNSVAVVSDGSAVLGLGDVGPHAAIPVMEGKAMIFREFAGISAWPICLDVEDPDAFVACVKAIAPVFGAINLEDVKAPRCFDIEARLINDLDIPVMHDDQHGTAIVALAALRNALRLVNKRIEDVKIVVAGMGAAGVATSRMLLAAGARQLVGCARAGVVIDVGKENLAAVKKDFYGHVRHEGLGRKLKEALSEADVFIGVSGANILRGADLKVMAKDPVVFAMANPDPEVDPKQALRYCRVFATGRSDLPNQINNALAYPGVFRGALDVRARRIDEGMKLAAADALSELITPDQLHEEYIIPSLFDERVVKAVAAAVSRAAVKSGLSRSRTAA